MSETAIGCIDMKDKFCRVAGCLKLESSAPSSLSLKNIGPGKMVAVHSSNLLKVLGTVKTVIAFVIGMSACAEAQTFNDLRKPEDPLVLQGIGSFYVGGRTISQSTSEIGLYRGGPLTVDQMYVQYLLPQGSTRPPIVMVHGGTLSGKSFETTPDGRMGWYEYFARNGFPSYVVDQVARARSGFNQASYNNVRKGSAAPASQPNIRRIANDVAWIRFRFGPAFPEKFQDTQFPVEAASEFAKQSVPDLTEGLPHPNPNVQALSELARNLKSAVLIGHSQAGRFPFEAALLDSQSIKALVAVEPGGCNSSVYSDEQVSKLAALPILIIFGDYIDAPQNLGTSWMDAYNDCAAFVARLNAVSKNAAMLHMPAIGIKGNSHMIMQDKNSLEIADLIIKWIETQSL
jgi:pimeloyl-ACP methyl ester carboxylesterase